MFKIEGNMIQTSKGTQFCSVRNQGVLCRRWQRTLESAAISLSVAPTNEQESELAFPGHGKMALTPDQKRIRDLEKKLKDTEMERDILKKAMAIFSRASK